MTIVSFLSYVLKCSLTVPTVLTFDAEVRFALSMRTTSIYSVIGAVHMEAGLVLRENTVYIRMSFRYTRCELLMVQVQNRYFGFLALFSYIIGTVCYAAGDVLRMYLHFTRILPDLPGIVSCEIILLSRVLLIPLTPFQNPSEFTQLYV